MSRTSTDVSELLREYLTPPEVAEILRVKAERVRRWIERGELAAANLGDRGRPRYRIARADLQAFLDRRAAARPAQSAPRSRRKSQEDLPCRY